MDIRNIKTGEVVFKDTFGSALAGICTADIYQDGRTHLVCVDVDGEGKLFFVQQKVLVSMAVDILSTTFLFTVRVYKPSEGKTQQISPNVEQEAIRELSIKKHHLLLELRNYEVGSLKRSPGVGEAPNLVSERQRNVGAIPVSVISY